MTKDREQRTLANILRVDHAGEYGAIRIYEAQLWVARWRARNLSDFLTETLKHERRHRDQLRLLMRQRGITPCRMLAVWGLGGIVLGLLTSLLGRNAILICTEAVERTVHRHLDDQITWLQRIDRSLVDALESIRAEELEHLSFAIRARGSQNAAWLQAVDKVVAAATELLIWASTYGASTRMAREVSAAKASRSAPGRS